MEMSVGALDHYNVSTRKLKETVQFYEEILGFVNGPRPQFVHETEVPFHEPWEARVMGIVRAMSPAADWNIDWFRHCRELIEPVDYLTRPYYDQWLQTYAAMLVNSDIATVQELASGQATSRPSGLGPTMSPVDVATAKRSERNFAQNIKERPALTAGEFRESEKSRCFRPHSASGLRTR